MSSPLFKPGATVLLRATKEMGRVLHEGVLDAGEYWYQVQFSKNRVDQVVEESIEPLQDPEETLKSLTARGCWGMIQAFRSALAVERITNTNQSTVYAFRGQRVLFEAFQYKPLLKILESPDRRLLIADEVGLGKTVETGLILAELEARQPLDRVLVVCPSRLREKWRDEMSRKFGQEFEIYTRTDVEEYVNKLKRNPGRLRLRAIVSMQTLRNSDLREQFLAEVGLIDLVVVDEAHHARNPSSQTSEMLRDVCEIAGAALLLTATPLHLGNRDLFTLLQALRPSEFRDFVVFDQRLQRYRGVHEAALHVRSQSEEGRERAKKILQGLFESAILPSNRDPLAIQVIRDMEGQVLPDRRGWVELERRVQDLHPLSSVLTRTRKRDVQVQAAVRRARVFRCQWTQEEDEAYRKLVEGSRKCGWIDHPMSLGQIQRARQAASCLPAALQSAWATAESDDDAVELTDVLPGDLLTVSREARPTPSLPPPVRDSKFEKLLALLELIEEEESGAKLLIFTYFKGTSRYLQERLTSKGYNALRIAGDVPSDPKNPDKDERGKIMRQFREDPAVRVLVSTEVGSEGLDFQFCHYLVNYDLPWNPMVVEQRIGRIDRFGQKADKLHILNLVVEGTVEERILLRLYERIGIFKHSIGQLEAILGEQMSQLQRDYVSGKLTPEEAEKRVDQAACAIEARQLDLNELEKNAGDLFGHEEYLKDQLKRVSRLGRYITEHSMLAVLQAFLQARHPSVRLWDEPEGVHHLRLTDELKKEIQLASSQDNVWIDRSRNGVFSFCFDGERAYHNSGVDLINVSHPFLRAAVDSIRGQLQNAHARAAKGVVVLSPSQDEELTEGTYFVLVFSHTVDGIRARVVLETIAWSEDRKELLPAETGERLLHLIQEQGLEWNPTEPAGCLPAETWDRMESEARKRNRALSDAEKRENEALFIRRTSVIKAEFEHDQEIKTKRLKTAEEKVRTRVIPALQGQIDKAKGRFEERMAELNRTKEAHCRLSAPIAACLVKIMTSSQQQ